MTEKFQSSNYKAFTPRVAKLGKRRVVSRSGVVFDRTWAFRSVYRNPIVAVKTLSISTLSLFRRGIAAVPQGDQFGFVHSIWTRGYYHWITESLPRALVMRQHFPDAVPLLPASYPKDYMVSLNAIGFDKVALFPDEQNVRVATPIVTECARSFATTDPSLLGDVRRRTRQHLGLSDAVQPHRLVYVSRAKARGRRVINEDEIIEVLKGFGAEIIAFEDYDFFGQVRLMAETRTLVSIHGAGLTNMVFMPEEGHVIEFIPRKNGIFDYNYVRNTKHHDPCYIRLAATMGHEYRHLVTDPDIASYKKTHMADVHVDPEALRRTLEELTRSGASVRQEVK